MAAAARRTWLRTVTPSQHVWRAERVAHRNWASDHVRQATEHQHSESSADDCGLAVGTHRANAWVDHQDVSCRRNSSSCSREVQHWRWGWSDTHDDKVGAASTCAKPRKRRTKTKPRLAVPSCHGMKT